ncbi:MAG: translation initiation factor IF-3 [Patescibacteria group bacterium]|nr:translation initiation factor IF-3 [Patescibacteria group bacterium]
MLKRYTKPQPSYSARINEQIRVPEVRVIDVDGAQLGVMPTVEAVAKAKERGLDLVEVSPKASPPVAKLVNYDKFRYQQIKLLQQQKKHQKKIDVKGIRLSIRTGPHDLEFKAKRADEFLKSGDKVKIDMMLRGRERANVAFAFEQVRKFLTMITVPHVVEVPPKKMGNMINAFLAPK